MMATTKCIPPAFADRLPERLLVQESGGDALEVRIAVDQGQSRG